MTLLFVTSVFHCFITDYCGALHTENHGILISPKHPGTYPSNLDCTYIILLNHTSQIQITTHQLDLEADYDRITYGIGGNVEMNSRGYFTGRRRLTESPLVWEVMANTVWLRFVSDYAVEYTGFNISWQATGKH